MDGVQRTLQSIASRAEDVFFVKEKSLNPNLRLRGLGKQRPNDSLTWAKASTGNSRWTAGPVENFLFQQLDDTESDTEILQALVHFGIPEKAIVTKVRLVNVGFCSSWLVY